MVKKISVDAEDKRSGFTVAELQDALALAPEDAEVRVLVGFRSQIKTLVIQVTE